MTDQQTTRRWHQLTPLRFVIGLLLVQIVLPLSERFGWFAFNEKKGWTVLVAVGAVGLAVLAMLLWLGVTLLLSQRRFQFTFRSLLLFVVTASFPLAWLALEMREARRQKEAVERISEVGGLAWYDYVYDEYGNATRATGPTAPAWLRTLLGDDFFCDVMHVRCGGTEFGDDDAVHLRELTDLVSLRFEHTNITDKGLVHLTGMTKLESLDLECTQITDNGLAHLEGMTALESLNLGGTPITDKGIVRLKGMTRLKELGLSFTGIGDEGVGQLTTLTRLKILTLVHVDATVVGVTTLQQARPNLRIFFIPGRVFL